MYRLRRLLSESVRSHSGDLNNLVIRKFRQITAVQLGTNDWILKFEMPSWIDDSFIWMDSCYIFLSFLERNNIRLGVIVITLGFLCDASVCNELFSWLFDYNGRTDRWKNNHIRFTIIFSRCLFRHAKYAGNRKRYSFLE